MYAIRSYYAGVAHAGAVDRVTRLEVVRAVEHHIGRANRALERRTRQAQGERHHLDLGIDRMQRGARRLGLGSADRIAAVQNLARNNFV